MTKTPNREEILNELLSYGERMSGAYKYSFAFGYVSNMLTDSQLKDLKRQLDRFNSKEGI